MMMMMILASTELFYCFDFFSLYQSCCTAIQFYDLEVKKGEKYYMASLANSFCKPKSFNPTV